MNSTTDDHLSIYNDLGIRLKLAGFPQHIGTMAERYIAEINNGKTEVVEREIYAIPTEDEVRSQLPTTIICPAEASGNDSIPTVELPLIVSRLSHDVVAASYANEALGVHKHFVLGSGEREVLMMLRLVLGRFGERENIVR
jgi:hypothetical protein